VTKIDKLSSKNGQNKIIQYPKYIISIKMVENKHVLCLKKINQVPNRGRIRLFVVYNS
jgi:hypothetical protein